MFKSTYSSPILKCVLTLTFMIVFLRVRLYYVSSCVFVLCMCVRVCISVCVCVCACVYVLGVFVRVCLVKFIQELCNLLFMESIEKEFIEKEFPGIRRVLFFFLGTL